MNRHDQNALRMQTNRHKIKIKYEIKGYVTKITDPDVRVYLTIQNTRYTLQVDLVTESKLN